MMRRFAEEILALQPAPDHAGGDAVEGQKKLKAARVLLIGAGGLGAPLGLYLAAAGVGHIGIVDFDVVDFTNLQRQVIYTTQDVGTAEAGGGAAAADATQPAHRDRRRTRRALTSENALEIFKDYDIIVDGTDNFPTRYLVNDACVLLGKPNVYGSIFRFEGQVSVFCAEGRAVLPLPLSRAAAAGAGAVVRRGRRARRAAGDRRRRCRRPRRSS